MACLEPLVQPSYSTGTAADVHELLLKIRDFASGLGWAIDAEDNYSGNEYGPDLLSDQSAQSGVIGPSTLPWTTSTGPNNGEWTIDSEVITVSDKGINDYRIYMWNVFEIGTYYEVEIEILSHIAGTLKTAFGQYSEYYPHGSLTSKGTYKIYGTCGEREASTYLMFSSDDFQGSFRVVHAKKVNAWSKLFLNHPDAGHFNLNTHAQITQPRNTNPFPYLDIRGARDYDPGQDENNQPGTSPNVRSNALYGPFASYHLFGTTQYIYCVVETWEGEYTHFGFGSIDKYYDFRGGQFLYGTAWQYANGYQNDSSTSRHDYPIGFYGTSTYWNVKHNYVQADLLGTTDVDRWLSDNHYSSNATRDRFLYAYKGFNQAEYWDNPYYGTAPFMPVHIAGEDINYYKYSLGEVPGYRKCSMRYLIPQDTVIIGNERWMVFPVKRKQIKTPDEYVSNSGSYGIALFHSYVT